MAYRGWSLKRDGDTGRPILTSLNGTRWDGPTLLADKIPNSDNTNGIYALTDDHHNKDQYQGMATVWGSVALSGIVVEGERGYRAQQATVRSLSLQQHPQDMKDVIQLEIVCALEDRYQCTVELDDDRMWRAIPDEELAPGRVFFASSTTQMLNPYQNQYQQNQYQQAMFGGGLRFSHRKR